MLHCEHILYTVIPVDSKQTLEDAYTKHKQVSNNVILINCGATLDLVEFLQPNEESVFYIIDSLRPLEVRNVYNGVQIKIIVLQNELGIEQKLVPEFEDIFDEENEAASGEDENEGSDEEQDDDEEDEDDEVKSRRKLTKRKRFDTEYLEKMHKKREWEDKR